MNVWSDYTQDESRLARLLNLLALILFGLSFLMLVTPYLLPAASLFVAPPFFVSNTIAGMVLMGFLAWFSAGDVRRFRAMIYALVGGFLIGAIAFLGMYLSSIGQSQATFLLLGFGLYAVAALVVTAFTFRATTSSAPWLPWIPEKPLSTWEQVARVVFGLFGLASLTAAGFSILLPFLDITLPADILINPFMIAGSTVKLGVLGLCALPVAVDVRRYTHHTQMISALIIGNAASLVVITLLWLFGFDRFGDYTLVIGGLSFTQAQTMLGAWVLDAVVIAGFLFLLGRINHTLLDYIGFLTPSQFRAMESIAETLVAGGEAELVPPHQIVLRTDSYLEAFHSERLGLARLAVVGLQLAPLAWFKPPINYL
ncbi:MAG: hypothetical protein K8L99_08190, partial [Anaerolineae bacterium]|nr:hypothetical protein [Anaerolineae bacterium]